MNCGYTKAGHLWEPGGGFVCGNVGRTLAGAGGRLDEAVSWSKGVIAPPELSPLSRRYKAIVAREQKAQEERREEDAQRLKEERREVLKAMSAEAVASRGDYRDFWKTEPDRPDAKERLKRERRELPPAGASRSYFDEG